MSFNYRLLSIMVDCDVISLVSHSAITCGLSCVERCLVHSLIIGLQSALHCNISRLHLALPYVLILAFVSPTTTRCLHCKVVVWTNNKYNLALTTCESTGLHSIRLFFMSFSLKIEIHLVILYLFNLTSLNLSMLILYLCNLTSLSLSMLFLYLLISPHPISVC